MNDEKLRWLGVAGRLSHGGATINVFKGVNFKGYLCELGKVKFIFQSVYSPTRRFLSEPFFFARLRNSCKQFKFESILKGGLLVHTTSVCSLVCARQKHVRAREKTSCALACISRCH